jgi:hypothetical protein
MPKKPGAVQLSPQLLAEALHSWPGVNKAVMKLDEVGCRALLDAELKGGARLQFLLRIHSRISRLRYDTERRELMELSKHTGYTTKVRA